MTCHLCGIPLSDAGERICSTVITGDYRKLEGLELAAELRSQILAYLGVNNELMEKSQWSSLNC